MTLLYRIHDWLLDFPNRFHRHHEWSDTVTLGGFEYDDGPFHFSVMKRRLKICLKCGTTDACAPIKPWCFTTRKVSA